MTLKTKTNLFISLAIVVLALPAMALADLRVAIDDGSTDSELFVYLDEYRQLAAVVDGADGDAELQATGACASGHGGYELRHSLAITSEFDFFLNRGVTIISDEEIDDDTQEQIRMLLAAAGHKETVIFVDGSTSAPDVSPAVSITTDSRLLEARD